jgi:CTP synthase
MVELPDHPWYVGCQFHPELKSRPTRPHPLFAGFVAAAREYRRHREADGSAGVAPRLAEAQR